MVQNRQDAAPTTKAVWTGNSHDESIRLAVKILPQNKRPPLAVLEDQTNKKIVISRSAGATLTEEQATAFLVAIGNKILSNEITLEGAKDEN